nr:hypothetical protein [Tanacetum cinerariifolium]
PAHVKAVESNCVTCGGAHSYQNCLATQENAYRGNIQEYVSQAAVANYNQGNTGFRPQMVANRIRPPGFPPHQNNQNNFNRGNNFNQNRGGNFNHSSFNQGQLHRPQPTSWSLTSNQTPQVPLILGRCFLKTSRALIDVYKGELTLRIGNEAITYNLDQTVRYSANYNQMTTCKIDVVEEYSQEEADAFLGLEDDPDSPKNNPFYYDPKGDILLLEAILNSEPSPPLPNQDKNLPSFKEELMAYEAQTVKSSVDEPPEVELKDLPHHLEYAF